MARKSPPESPSIRMAALFPSRNARIALSTTHIGQGLAANIGPSRSSAGRDLKVVGDGMKMFPAGGLFGALSPDPASCIWDLGKGKRLGDLFTARDRLRWAIWR